MKPTKRGKPAEKPPLLDIRIVLRDSARAPNNRALVGYIREQAIINRRQVTEQIVYMLERAAENPEGRL